MATLDATPGGSSANAYVTIEQATAYHAQNLNRTIWTNADMAKKVAAVMMATRLLDQGYRWFGAIATDAQALRWPRQYLVDVDGREVSAATIPLIIQQATAELALWLLRSDRVVALDGSSGDVNSVKVGAIAVAFASGQQSSGDEEADLIPAHVDQIVRAYGRRLAGSLAVPLVRS